MQPVSGKWAPALTTDHGIVTEVDVLYDGSLVASDIAFESGSVAVDRGSEVRRSLTLTIPDPADFPINPTDLYGVYGQRITVTSGIRYLDGSTELVPVGTFAITAVGGDIHTGPLTVTGSGLEILLKQEVAEFAVSTATYGTARALLQYLADTAAPGVGFVDLSSAGINNLATKTWEAGTPFLQIAQEVAESIGAEFFSGAAGTFVLQDIPLVSDLPSAAHWDVSAGEGGIMVSANVSLTADDVYNKVTVLSENTADDVAPVEGSATITDPLDPIRYGGPFGKRVYRTTSSLATSQSAAIDMAKGILEKKRAPNRSVTINSVPNPALDAGDWIRAVYGPGIASELHMIQSFTLPLSVDSPDFTLATVGGREESGSA